jgi:hypothetical protein
VYHLLLQNTFLIRQLLCHSCRDLRLVWLFLLAAASQFQPAEAGALAEGQAGVRVPVLMRRR